MNESKGCFHATVPGDNYECCSYYDPCWTETLTDDARRIPTHNLKVHKTMERKWSKAYDSVDELWEDLDRER